MGVELPEDCRGRWVTFVDQTLSETNRKNTIDLVSVLIFFLNETDLLALNTNVFALWPPDWHRTPSALLRG